VKHEKSAHMPPAGPSTCWTLIGMANLCKVRSNSASLLLESFSPALVYRPPTLANLKTGPMRSPMPRCVVNTCLSLIQTANTHLAGIQVSFPHLAPQEQLVETLSYCTSKDHQEQGYIPVFSPPTSPPPSPTDPQGIANVIMWTTHQIA